MTKIELHILYNLLNNSLYLSMEDHSLPKHMQGIQEALMIVKREINDYEKEFEQGKEE